jgi:hypothetical protein
MNFRIGIKSVILLLLVAICSQSLASTATTESNEQFSETIDYQANQSTNSHIRLKGEDIHAIAYKDFDAGVTAYKAGQFELAAHLFSDSLAGLSASGTLLNLGLAEWRTGKSGAAILSWEQSAYLNPFDHSAQVNLSFARDIIFVNEPELSRCELASTWLPSSWWAWLACGSLWLAVGMMTLPGFFRLPKSNWHQTLAALALGIFILSLAPNYGVVTRATIGIIVEKNTALCLTPTRSAATITSLSAGEPIRQLRVRGEYIFVHSQSGNGWIKQQQVKFICP